MIKTLLNLICNYNLFSRNFNKISEQDCFCSDDEYRNFVDKDHGLIITGNLDIIEDLEIRELFKKGSKFRCLKAVNSNQNKFSFSNDLDICIAKLAKKI